MRLLNQLRQLAPALDTIPNLNLGGCGVVAANVGQYIPEEWQPGCAVARSYWAEPIARLNLAHILETNPNIKSPDDWEEFGVIMAHIVVKFQTPDGARWQYDSTGLMPDMPEDNWRRVFYAGLLPVEYVRELSQHERYWNPSFDRDRGIPAIERLCRDYLTL